MNYDLFLSHNQQQKPWVRRFCEFLRQKKLRVFFDEDSIPPGEPIVAGVERGLRESRHVLLILSPASLGSKWVAMETLLALHDDPDGSEGRLIPIVVETVDRAQMRSSLTARNYIDLTNPHTRRDRLQFLLQHLGIRELESTELDNILPNAGDSSDEQVRIGGVEEVLAWGWDGIKLLEEFIALDYATLDGLSLPHEGSPAQWAPVFMNHPETWRMLITGSKRIVGYWHYAPLFPEDHEVARKGDLLDSSITADRIRLFELEGTYDMYFVQICLHPNFRKPRYVRRLFESICQVMQALAHDGVFFSEICANAYTDMGRSICKSFNMSYVREHCDRGSIFVGTMANLLMCSVARMHPELISLYGQRTASAR